MKLDAREFETLVARALDGLPREFARLLENVVVVVENEPSEEDMRSVGLDPDEDELLGLYQGVPQPDRDVSYDQLPDRVVVYRGPICRECSSRDEVVAEVLDTVIHELGHHFGLADDDMPY